MCSQPTTATSVVQVAWSVQKSVCVSPWCLRSRVSLSKNNLLAKALEKETTMTLRTDPKIRGRASTRRPLSKTTKSCGPAEKEASFARTPVGLYLA